MCGIVGYVGGQSAVGIIVEGLKRLEYRGYDSAGIAILHDGTLNVRRAAGRIKGLEAILNERPLTGSLGIGHTRWATHGRPSEDNAHPHTDCQGSLVVVHNGIIENYLEIRSGCAPPATSSSRRPTPRCSPTWSSITSSSPAAWTAR